MTKFIKTITHNTHFESIEVESKEACIRVISKDQYGREYEWSDAKSVDSALHVISVYTGRSMQRMKKAHSLKSKLALVMLTLPGFIRVAEPAPVPIPTPVSQATIKEKAIDIAISIFFSLENATAREVYDCLEQADGKQNDYYIGCYLTDEGIDAWAWEPFEDKTVEYMWNNVNNAVDHICKEFGEENA